MDDPGNRMGPLDGLALRATRVVLDIGGVGLDTLRQAVLGDL